ncbi:LysR substrate-binding domain-containing protein [Streptomyces sp. NPDC096193]|uniref:LysR family transcriptional regulator n=1 Tax=Streptomyces sp. NPDC096193 TaxID=3155821 RepID=UPI00331ED3B7
MDVDLRKLRYFVAVADEMHFGRAAERLHIAQPVLSRQIRILEDELGAQLFERDRRGTRLTPAGDQLLEDAVPLLASAGALTRRVGSAARGTTTFTVGFMPGITVTSAVVALASRHPDVDVRLLRTSWDDQVAVLLDGRADVGVVRLPIDTRGLKVRHLFQEPRVVMLPTAHRLAGGTSVTLEDLSGEHLLQDPDAVPGWREVALEMRDPQGRPALPPIRHVEEKLELVAAGAGISVLPLSTACFYTRPDVTAVRVEGIGPSEVALAWVGTRRSLLIRDFTEAALEVLADSQFEATQKRAP